MLRVRRTLSGLCLLLMFTVVSLAQSAFWLSRTVFDTDAFGDAVRVAAARPEVRDALGEDVAGQLGHGRSLDAQQRADLRGAADAAVASPAFADELATTLTRAHAALLAGRNPATVLELGTVQEDVRRSLASTDPRLARAVPERELRRPVDPGRLPWVPRAAGAIGTAVPLLVGLALVLLVLAVAVARDRPRTLRRAGYVLVASAVFTLVARFVIPAVLVPVLPAGVVRTIGHAVVQFFLGALLPAMVVTAGTGAALVAGGVAWSRARARPRGSPSPLPATVPAVPSGPAVTRRPEPATATAPLPVSGPPIANVDVVRDSETPTVVEDAGGWGPLRY